MSVVTEGYQTTPVDNWYAFLPRMHTFMRQKLPFSYFTYRSLVLEGEDDLLEIIKKVGDVITLRYFFLFCGKLVSPCFRFLPLIPFAMDVLWNLCPHKTYVYLTPEKAKEYKSQFDVKTPRLYSTLDAIRSIAYLSFIILGVYVIEKKLPLVEKLIKKV